MDTPPNHYTQRGSGINTAIAQCTPERQPVVDIGGGCLERFTEQERVLLRQRMNCVLNLDWAGTQTQVHHIAEDWTGRVRMSREEGLKLMYGTPYGDRVLGNMDLRQMTEGFDDPHITIDRIGTIVASHIFSLLPTEIARAFVKTGAQRLAPGGTVLIMDRDHVSMDHLELLQRGVRTGHPQHTREIRAMIAEEVASLVSGGEYEALTFHLTPVIPGSVYRSMKEFSHKRNIQEDALKSGRIPIAVDTETPPPFSGNDHVIRIDYHTVLDRIGTEECTAIRRKGIEGDPNFLAQVRELVAQKNRAAVLLSVKEREKRAEKKRRK